MHSIRLLLASFSLLSGLFLASSARAQVAGAPCAADISGNGVVDALDAVAAETGKTVTEAVPSEIAVVLETAPGRIEAVVMPPGTIPRIAEGRGGQEARDAAEEARVEVLRLHRATAWLSAGCFGVVVGVGEHRLHAQARAIGEVLQHPRRHLDVALELDFGHLAARQRL